MQAIRTGILHVPATDGEAGAAIATVLRSAGIRPLVVSERSAQSQRNWITDILCRWCDEDELDLVLTVGGTLPAPGPSGLEIVPEATADAIERELPGLAEAMRAYAKEESDLALLERGRVGVRGRTLIVNLPQGSGPASLFLEAIAGLIEPVCAHLRQDPAAPTLAQALTAMGHDVDLDAAEVPDHAKRGLNDADFAAFLRRSAQQESRDP